MSQPSEVQTGVSYVVSFYINVQQLTDFLARYADFLLRLKNQRVQNDSGIKLSDEDKQETQQICMNIRFLSQKCYIGYMSLCKASKKETDKELIETYNKIKNSIVVVEADVEKLVMLLNLYLLQDVVKNILESNQDIVDAIFSSQNAS